MSFHLARQAIDLCNGSCDKWCSRYPSAFDVRPTSNLNVKILGYPVVTAIRRFEHKLQLTIE
jgi:hypothetical protein